VSDPRPIRVLVADDHPVVREGLRALISRRSDMKVVAEAATGPEVLVEHARHRPDVALVDLRLPEMDGIEVTLAIRRRTPDARIVILTSFGGDEDIYRALRAGASSYMLKDSPRQELLECIRAVHEGRPSLPAYVGEKLRARLNIPEFTPRERDVLRLIVAGRSNKQIGAALHAAEGTVKAHANRIFRKLGVTTRTEAVTEAVKRGIVHLDTP
jgi:two-component system NarL family response regulator